MSLNQNLNKYPKMKRHKCVEWRREGLWDFLFRAFHFYLLAVNLCLAHDFLAFAPTDSPSHKNLARTANKWNPVVSGKSC